MDIKVSNVIGRRALSKFIKFPWKIYKNNPYWVAPLISEQKKFFNPKKNPFYGHSKVQLFLAYMNNEIVGRISAHINYQHNKFHQDNVGFFGFFECIENYNVARELLNTAYNWLKENGKDTMRGPANFSSNEEWGLLINGYDDSPYIMMTYNPVYYQQFFERYGLKKAKDIYSFHISLTEMPERFIRAIDLIKRRHNFTIRTLDIKNMKKEIKIAFEIYNKAWEKNWGFVPMTKAEFEYTAKNIANIIDPDFVFIVEKDEKPVAFSLTVPDFNQALKKINGRLFPFGLFKLLYYSKRINQVRVITLGIIEGYKRMGIDVLLYYKAIETGLKKHCSQGEMGWILEDNFPMIRPIERIGGKHCKTYRIYDINIK